jgi:hypothetical protein
VGTHGGAYRRRQPEGTVLYEAVRENLATLLAEASEVGRGLPRYVERDVSQVPGMRSAGARLRAGALRELQGRAARRLLVQGPRGVPVLQREAGACDGGAPGGAGAATRALPAVDAVVSAPGPVGAAQGRGTALGRPHRLPARGVYPATPKGTAAGPAGWAVRCRVVHPVLRLRTSMPATGRGWSGCAAMGRVARWRWSACREWKMAASPTA